MKSAFFKSLLLLLALLPQMLWADNGGYYIRNYHVDVTVHKDNVFDVTETVDLTFTAERHGFYRYIPYSFRIPISDENADEGYRTMEYLCDIDDVKVDGWDYDVEDESNNTIIRIGSEYHTVSGDQTYIIHYTFTYPDDRISDCDFIYHTLLPVDCNVPIKHFSFKMKFDKALDDDFLDYLEVYYGSYGEDRMAENVTIDFKNNTLMGYADNITPNHTVTIYAPLSEGYFEGAKSVSPIPCMLLFGISLLLILLILFYELTIKHPHITKTIEFYPPDGISSAEVGTIIDETVDLVDIASLIPWWAGQGYITIKEIPDSKGRVGKHAQLELTKKCDLPSSAPTYQKKLWSLLFDEKSVVNLSEIGEKPHQFQTVNKELNKVFVKDKELSTLSSKYFYIILLLITTSLMFCVSSPIAYFYTDNVIMTFGLWIVPFIVGMVWCEHARSLEFMNSKLEKIISPIFRFIVMAVLCGITIYFFPADDNCSLLPASLCITIFVGSFLVTELSTRFTINTPYRVEMMGKLLGLKEFIQTAEKPQLEQLQNDDPDYFYKIMPYAMVFGLTKKWADLFADIATERPEWYQSDIACSNMLFAHNFTESLSSSVMRDINVISHDPSSSSSSGGGGGFSGGGGGGGGCGSW